MNKQIWLLAAIFILLFVNIPLADAASCDVSVNNVQVNGDERIDATIQNTGDHDSDITYAIYVGNRFIVSNIISLGSGESYHVDRDYNFGNGRYEVRVEARSRCTEYGYYPYGTSFDSKTITYESDNYNYCSSHYTGDYRCSGQYLQQKYQDSSCDSRWVNVQYCDDGCSNNRCNYDNYYNDYYPDYDYDTNRYIQCYVGDLWWYDSNNHREVRYQNCEDGCFGGKCVEDSYICTQDAYKTCYNGDVWTYDSCGHRDDLYTDCEFGCSSGRCTGYYYDDYYGNYNDYDPYYHIYDYPYYTKRTCEIEISSFDYTTNLESGDKASVTASILNEGNMLEYVKLEIFVDGVSKEKDSFYVSTGDVKTKELKFISTTGEHDILFIATANCGDVDSESATVVYKDKSKPTTCNNNNVCESFESASTCPNDCFTAEPAKSTSVTISPTDLDTKINRAKIVSVKMYSTQDQDFTIEISGAPEGWVTFDDTINVNAYSEETSYIYIYPQDGGTYTFDISVKAEEQNKLFKKEIDLFVASAPAPEPEDNQENVEESTDEGLSFTGDVVSKDSIRSVLSPFIFIPFAIGIIIIIIAFASIRMKQ
ncbi:MAG: hypothetical protein ABIJ92_00440 [Candidatus Aenigmatarchaeota archaeon]